VWLGFSAASLVGVPGATAIGDALGWRAAFWMLAAVGVIAGRFFSSGCPRLRVERLRASDRKSSPCGVLRFYWLWR
jgi:predicted MFS family arabinose efflux permease